MPSALKENNKKGTKERKDTQRAVARWPGSQSATLKWAAQSMRHNPPHSA